VDGARTALMQRKSFALGAPACRERATFPRQLDARRNNALGVLVKTTRVLTHAPAFLELQTGSSLVPPLLLSTHCPKASAAGPDQRKKMVTRAASRTQRPGLPDYSAIEVPKLSRISYHFSAAFAVLKDLSTGRGLVDRVSSGRDACMSVSL